MKTYQVFKNEGTTGGMLWSVVEFTDGAQAREVARFYRNDEATAYAKQSAENAELTDAIEAIDND